MSASSGLAIALAVSSDKPWRVKSLALAAHIAEMLPSELISRISEAPPIEGFPQLLQAGPDPIGDRGGGAGQGDPHP